MNMNKTAKRIAEKEGEKGKHQASITMVKRIMRLMLDELKTQPPVDIARDLNRGVDPLNHVVVGYKG